MERDWEAFEKAENQLRRARRAGYTPGLRPARRVALGQGGQELRSLRGDRGGLEACRTGVGGVRPDGQLNDRAWAQAQVAPALAALVGRAWGRVVNHLRTPESFTFLDRMHDALALIPVPQELRDALVRLWWLRRQRPGKSVTGAVAGAGHVAHVVQQELCQKLDPNWREWYRQVAAVLAVQCVPAVRWSA